MASQNRITSKALPELHESNVEPKVCKTCGKVISESKFVRQRGYIRRWCKPCRNFYMSEWRKSHRESCRNSVTKWLQANPEKRASRRKAYKQRYPEKTRARYLVYFALQSGAMKRPKVCSVCRISCTPQAHHVDYSKPYDVTWACRNCHYKIHGSLGGLRNEA